MFIILLHKTDTVVQWEFFWLACDEGFCNFCYSSTVNDDQVKPRSLRFTWSMKTTSSRDPNEIMAEIRKVNFILYHNFFLCWHLMSMYVAKVCICRLYSYCSMCTHFTQYVLIWVMALFW